MNIIVAETCKKLGGVVGTITNTSVQGGANATFISTATGVFSASSSDFALCSNEATNNRTRLEQEVIEYLEELHA